MRVPFVLGLAAFLFPLSVPAQPGGVAVAISTPPWWGLEHTLGALILMGTILLIGVVLVYTLLRRSNDELERRVAERTVELSETNLSLQREIDERRKAEGALEHERHLFNVIMDNVPEAIYFKDTEGRFVRVNRALLKKMGLKDYSQMLGRTDVDFFSPEEAEEWLAEEQEIVRTGLPFAGKEEKEILQDGREFWAITAKMPLRDPAGKIMGTFGITHDITERKTAEEALRLAHVELEQRIGERTVDLQHANRLLQQKIGEHEQAEQLLRKSEERFARAFHATPVAVGITTVEEGRFLDANESFLHLFEFRREEILGRTAVELGLWLSPEDRQRLVALLQRHGFVRGMEMKFRTKSGALRDTLISIELIDLGEAPCLLFLTYDVTERVHLENQLRQSQKMEAVGQLAAGIAHDFNNIMTIIRGYTSLLLAGAVSDAEKEAGLREIGIAADRAASLTQQLLTFSRKRMMQLRSLDFDQVIEGIARMLRRLLGETIELELIRGDDGALIEADQSMMEQVLLNLAVNARDAMPGGGRLTVETSRVRVDGEYVRNQPAARVGDFVCLRITDTGCGMETAVLARIFEPFFTTKDVGKGTGLGLATVYGIVLQHHGWIQVESEPGKGATFRVCLPESSRPQAMEPEFAAHVVSTRGGETILVAEDELSVLELIKSILTRQGYRILMARSGNEALDIWQEQKEKIDLLLTDMMMPGGTSGLELSERLLVERPDLPVIFSSGYSLELVQEEVELEAGVNFLPKPYLPAELVRMVRARVDAARPVRR